MPAVSNSLHMQLTAWLCCCASDSHSTPTRTRISITQDTCHNVAYVHWLAAATHMLKRAVQLQQRAESELHFHPPQQNAVRLVHMSAFALPKQSPHHTGPQSTAGYESLIEHQTKFCPHCWCTANRLCGTMPPHAGDHRAGEASGHQEAHHELHHRLKQTATATHRGQRASAQTGALQQVVISPLKTAKTGAAAAAAARQAG
jgi:hypothetical protein